MTTDLLDYLITHISELPQNVQLIGGGLIALFVLRSFFLVLRLRLISAATSLLYALIVALVLARYGHDIAAFIGNSAAQAPSPEDQ